MDAEKYQQQSDILKNAAIPVNQNPVPQKQDFPKKSFICPYPECGKKFTESGNLKTHIRIHVNSEKHAKNRLVKGRFHALMPDVVRVS